MACARVALSRCETKTPRAQRTVEIFEIFLHPLHGVAPKERLLSIGKRKGASSAQQIPQRTAMPEPLQPGPRSRLDRQLVRHVRGAQAADVPHDVHEAEARPGALPAGGGCGSRRPRQQPSG